MKFSFFECENETISRVQDSRSLSNGIKVVEGIFEKTLGLTGTQTNDCTAERCSTTELSSHFGARQVQL